MEVVPDVHLVEGVRGSNVYLLEDEKLVLVDTGLPGNTDVIIEYIKSMGRDPGDLASIIVTHGHLDHMGSLHKLRRSTGAAAIAHKDEVIRNREGKHVLSPFIDATPALFILLAISLFRMAARSYGFEMPFFVSISLRVVSITVLLILFGFISVPGSWLERGLFRFARFKRRLIDRAVRDKEVLPHLGGIHIVHTPGHTPGSISVFLPERKVIIVGDTIINNGDRLSRPVPLRANRDEAEQSLEKLAQLDFDTCLFGHGSPLRPAREKVEQLAGSYPRSLLLWRIIRCWQRLIRFTINLFRRH